MKYTAIDILRKARNNINAITSNSYNIQFGISENVHFQYLLTEIKKS